jgi:four helix bundle protein
MPDNYQSLIAWQRGMDLVHAIYATTANFPSDERFSLTDQMRRAAVSIVSNIAEGHGRFSKQETRRYLRTARGSLYELETQILVAARLGYLKEASLATILQTHAMAAKPLQGLIAHLDIECR